MVFMTISYSKQQFAIITLDDTIEKTVTLVRNTFENKESEQTTAFWRIATSSCDRLVLTSRSVNNLFDDVFCAVKQ